VAVSVDSRDEERKRANESSPLRPRFCSSDGVGVSESVESEERPRRLNARINESGRVVCGADFAGRAEEGEIGDEPAEDGGEVLSKSEGVAVRGVDESEWVDEEDDDDECGSKSSGVMSRSEVAAGMCVSSASGTSTPFSATRTALRGSGSGAKRIVRLVGGADMMIIINPTDGRWPFYIIGHTI